MYDYVIVGAGSAGCVLAARLSEDPDTSVLLLEAGPPDSNQNIHVPLGYLQLARTEIDWDYASAPEPNCNGRRVSLPRGRVLGGSSSVNAMIYIRGNRRDYDEWGVPGWTWEDLFPYFLKAEDNERVSATTERPADLGAARHGRGDRRRGRPARPGRRRGRLRLRRRFPPPRRVPRVQGRPRREVRRARRPALRGGGPVARVRFRRRPAGGVGGGRRTVHRRGAGPRSRLAVHRGDQRPGLLRADRRDDVRAPDHRGRRGCLTTADPGEAAAAVRGPGGPVPRLRRLAGRRVDNLPGATGIGAKTAAKLLAAFWGSRTCTPRSTAVGSRRSWPPSARPRAGA